MFSIYPLPNFLSERSRSLASAMAALSVVIVSPSKANGAEEDAMLANFESEIMPVLDQYCYDCHGYGSDKGGVVLDDFSNDLELQDHGLWLRVLKNVRAGLMPPSDEDQPSDASKAMVLDWIKFKAFKLDPMNPDPGHMTLRRLNRVEYRNTVKDLIGYDYDTALEFPADDTGHGFDNMGEVLTISPMLLEKYFDAAQEIVRETVPQQPRIVAEESIPGRRFLAEGEEAASKDDWDREFSYYEAIRTKAQHRVEIAGDYKMTLDLMAVESYVDNQFDLNKCRFRFKIDGELVIDREFAREGWKSFEMSVERHFAEGEHEFEIEIVPLTPGVEQIRNLRLRVNDLAVLGPFDEDHFVAPANYKTFFPKPVPDSESAQREYAEELLGSFATKAFRRPVDSYTLGRLVDLAMYSASADGKTFESGIAQAYVAILASPRFLFREESIDATSVAGGYALIDEYSLASRLSYFLWSTMPDEELFSLAQEGTLRSQLDGQVKRMMAHPKAKAFVENFVGQWLQARDIGSVQISDFQVWLRENPDPELSRARAIFRSIREIPEAQRTEAQKQEYEEARNLYISSYRMPRPDLNRKLRNAMEKESQLVFEHVIQGDRSIVELIDSDYTFLNEELAEHYGIEGVEGERMRRVQLPEDSPRGGVLTQGTVLAVTSNPTRTSPVKRGVFILDNILGTPPPPPPPNIPALEDVASEEELAQMSLRETLELHASKRACRSCHSRMDPLGLALENFNAMGRWRDSEMNQGIEPEGTLISGESFSNIRELKEIIATSRREDFYYCFTEKLMTYALGRGLDYYDVDTVDHLVQSLETSGGKPSVLIRGIIDSAAFQKSRVHETSTDTTVAREASNATPDRSDI